MPRQTRAAASKSREDILTSATSRSARSRHVKTEIKNTSEASSDESMQLDGGDAALRSKHWPKVVVPQLNAKSTDSAASPAVSVDTSFLDETSLNDDDTPLTSAMATPFEKHLTPFDGRRKTRSSRSSLNQQSANVLGTASASRARRLPFKQEDLDERLARELQEQEYGGDTIVVSTKQQKRTSRKGLVGTDDEEEDDELLTQNLSFSSSASRKRKLPVEFDRATKRKQPIAIEQSNSRLPTRSARDKARSSLTAKAATDMQMRNEGITFSDDDDEQSDVSNEYDMDSEESELSELSDLVTDSESAEFDKGGPAPITKKNKKAVASLIRAAGGRYKASRTPRFIFRSVNESRADFERRRLEHAHPKLKDMWDNLAAVPVVRPQQSSQPEGISRKLKSFQLEGVDWMRRMEKEGQWKGGLLGDEMGMGKTIQAVSLIMSDYPAGKPTLVVVPPVALMQWSAEINAYTDGKLKVLIHHNTDPKVKTMKKKDVEKYDVIMISYSGLESIHRKEVKGWKRDDGLVKENSRIHAIQYHRLILDEAHSIKTRTTQVAKACFALKADYKWCLSGTPVQNRIGEFFSLLRFLEVEPFASYFCKECSCESLHWSQDDSGRCDKCHHTGFQHVSLFNQELLNPITSGDIEERDKAMKKLRLLTDRIMLRRMKRDHTSSMELPPKQITIHNEFFGPEERDFSRSIMTNTTRTFDTYVARGVELNNYANIFGLIMQMRQVANHPDLILKKNAHGGQNILVCSVCDEPAEEPIRSQCHHDFCRRCVKDYVRSFDSNGEEPDCPHCHIRLRIDFDQPEIEQDAETVKKSSIINRIKMEDWHSSTKIETLIYELFSLRSQKRTTKSIVFSQFTSMLQLIEWRLRRAGFNTVMLDGSMSPSQRQKSIEYFMNNVKVEIFLVSLKAGGVALNLTEASRVFIVDPWWNPAAEWQSADRCHRIGQRRPCQITRLCIEDSVESRMVLLQEKKANLINGTVNGDDVALGKLTPEDLQFLFKGT